MHAAYASQSEADQSSALASGGDVITEVDGQIVTSIQHLVDYINTKNVGDTVQLTIVRGSFNQTVQAKLAQWPSG